MEGNDDLEFENMKRALQDILDKHIPVDKRFSVMNFNKEQIWYVSKLLLEKDDKKRELLFMEIENKLKESQFELRKQYYEILKNKELFDNYVSVLKGTDDLLNDMESDNELELALENI